MHHGLSGDAGTDVRLLMPHACSHEKRHSPSTCKLFYNSCYAAGRPAVDRPNIHSIKQYTTQQ
eukprot:5505669-Amphidinium_carterae.1